MPEFNEELLNQRVKLAIALAVLAIVVAAATFGGLVLRTPVATDPDLKKKVDSLKVDLAQLASEKTTELDDRLERVVELQQKAIADLTTLKADLINLKKTDLIDFKIDLTNSRADLINFKADLINLLADLTNLRADLINLKADVINLKTDLYSHKADH